MISTDNQQHLEQLLKRRNQELADYKDEIQMLRRQMNKNSSNSYNETIIIQKHTKEKEIYETKILQLQKEILIFKEEKEQKTIEDKMNFQNTGNKKLYDQIFDQEKQLEALQNKLNSSLEDNFNLKKMLQDYSKSKRFSYICLFIFILYLNILVTTRY